jgi:hypothetical protein
MARVGEGFPLECPACGGDIRLIAFITEPEPIQKILTHLGESLEPPPVPPARGPPTEWGELGLAHDDRDVFQALLISFTTPFKPSTTPDEMVPLARNLLKIRCR